MNQLTVNGVHPGSNNSTGGAAKSSQPVKHSLATLAHLGYQKLSDYVSAKNAEVKKRVARL